MASVGLHREKYLLSLGIVGVLSTRYAGLPRPSPVLQMVATNLRNRPLSTTNVNSLCRSLLALYHSLITGSKEFPFIPYRGFNGWTQLTSPLAHTSQWENAAPSPQSDGPAGMMVPPAGSRSSPPNMLTPVLPERTELGLLRADPRNCVCEMEIDGSTVTRVISTVYNTEGTELTNRWRVTDYSADGQVLQSVLCQFIRRAKWFAERLRQEKRRATEEDSSSSQSPPKKRLRL